MTILKQNVLTFFRAFSHTTSSSRLLTRGRDTCSACVRSSHANVSGTGNVNLSFILHGEKNPTTFESYIKGHISKQQGLGDTTVQCSLCNITQSF